MYQNINNINQDSLNASLRFLDKMGQANAEMLKQTDPEQGERIEKLGALLANEDFCQKFIACTTKQEAYKLFADNGSDLTEEEINGLALQLKALTQKLIENDGELSEEDLEQIAGGGTVEVALTTLFVAPAGIGAAAGVGALIGSVIPGLGTAVGALVGGMLGVVGTGLALFFSWD